MFESQNIPVAEICLERELVDEEVLASVRHASADQGRSLADILVDQGLVDKSILLDSVAQVLDIPRIRVAPPEISRDIIQTLEPAMARMYGVVPYEVGDSFVRVMAMDPFNSHVVDDLSFNMGRAIRVAVADPRLVEELLDVYYRSSEEDYIGILEEIDLSSVEGGAELTTEDLLSMAGETPIVRLVNLVLAQAIRDKASDVHFEPFEHEFKVRYRIDGALYEMSPPPRELALLITSRIKVISNLNIAESRVPQDGKVRLTVSGRPVDLRVSTLPTQFGESVVLRVLDQTVTSLELENLGMPPEVVSVVRKTTDKPNGIFIVTGPTGSGKTTTLYSCLKRLNQVDSKLMTAEDPIEYEIDGIMQVAVNPLIGLSFANALKAFLRQDPDVIMVGEIRDLETAQISIQASLTGHLVLSTLHTNDAPGAVTRLVDMGVEPFLISSSIEAVLAQRLLRRICAECRRSFTPNAAMIEQLDLDEALVADKEFYQGVGCPSCARTGYRGRLGIYEMLEMTERIRELISEEKPASVIKEEAVQQGMRTLRDDGLRGIFSGATTLEEVIRYT